MVLEKDVFGSLFAYWQKKAWRSAKNVGLFVVVVVVGGLGLQMGRRRNNRCNDSWRCWRGLELLSPL